MSLSILCVTRAEDIMLPQLRAFGTLADACRGTLVLGADGQTAADRLGNLGFNRHQIVPVAINPDATPESVFDYVIDQCQTDYIFRLDDDELPSSALADWLIAGGYKSERHWAFPRAHLWGDSDHYLTDLWPDYQTRCSIKALAGGRFELHKASPHGIGAFGPGAILHHKFLLRSYAQRAAIADRYERVRVGAGRSRKFLRYQLPEDVYAVVETAPLVDRCMQIAVAI